MDEIDHMGDLIDIENETLIKRASNRPLEAQATGACLYCGDKVKPGFRWCSPECRDDWEMVR